MEGGLWLQWWSLCSIVSLPLHSLCHLSADLTLGLGKVTTSTAVEHGFSQGCQLLSFTHNWLHALSVHAFLCMGSWGRNNLIFFEDILASVRSNSKRKRDVLDIEIVA